jgi:predicted MFS family arabinose efflux permease
VALVFGVPSIRPEEHRPYSDVVRSPMLLRPLLIFFPAAAAYGAVYSFLPLLAPERAATGLLVFGAAAAVARFALGPLTARFGGGALGPTLVTVGAIAMALVAWGPDAALLAALLAGGATLGGLATASFVTTVARVGPDEYALASGVWNLAYDSGMGTGAVILGAVAGLLGPAAVFGCVAVAVGSVLPLALRDRSLVARQGGLRRQQGA